MPPKKQTTTNGEANGGAVTLNDGDIKMINAIFTHSLDNTRPNADWDKVAVTLGLANAKCSKERFRQICQKHGWFKGDGSNPVNTPESVKRKKANGDGEDPQTPTTKKRRPPVPQKDAVQVNAQADDEMKEAFQDGKMMNDEV
jgi:hypothetical protein